MWDMKKNIELIDISFKNLQEYFNQSIDTQRLRADFIETLSDEQKQMLDNLLDSIYKFHRLDNEEYIVHTCNICKEILN